jgi:hypothetical protein
MRKLGSPLPIVIAIGLLAGSAVAVTAQEAPVEFTAEWGFGPNIESGARVNDEDAVRYRGDVWRPSTVTESSDPRFRGDLTNSWNHDDYPDGSTIGAVTYTVRNDEGAWIMEPTLTLDFPDPGVTSWNVVFVGEDAYEGSLALVNIVTVGEGWELHGYIVDASSLPTVEPYQP